MTHIKTYRDHLLEHPMMGPEAALMQEVKELRSVLMEAQRDAKRCRIALSNCIDAIENCQCLLNLHDLEGFAKTCVGANNTAIELAHAAMKGAA